MPKADYQIEGYRIFWHSNDHAPEHFHIEYRGHWEIRIYFVESMKDDFLHFDIVWPKTRLNLTGRELRLFQEYVISHQEHLLREWETKVCT